jgi:hypothetical protein
MPVEPYTGVQLPAIGDTDNVPAWLLQIFTALGPKHVLTVLDSAERSSKYADAPAGVLVIGTGAPLSVWMKTAATDDWLTVYQARTDFTVRISNDANATIASSTNVAYYDIAWGQVRAHGEATLSAAAANCFADLPVVAKQRLMNFGTAGLYGVGTPSDQTGLAYMASTSRLVITAFSQGYRDGAAGQTLRFDVTYEAAE